MSGIINWGTNGHEFSMKGLKYFGIGAAAGALGAAVGAGISSALPIAGKTSGGFIAGFWGKTGTAGATVATTRFISSGTVLIAEK